MGNKNSKKDPTKLSEEEIELLLANTSFTRDEIHNWHEGFLKDCPNGKLDKKKFIDIYKLFYPDGKADKFCTHVFKVFDTNLSGHIDFIEFLTSISVTAQGDTRKKLTLAFKVYDSDGNGRVDKKEMEKIIEAIYDLVGETDRKASNSPKERVREIMSKLDKDNSGYLNEMEFVDGCLNDSFIRGLLAPNS